MPRCRLRLGVRSFVCRVAYDRRIGIRFSLTARKNLTEDLGDDRRIFDTLIQFEQELRRELHFQSVADLSLQKAGRVLESLEAEFLFLVISHDRDVDAGLAQIAGDRDVRYGHVVDTGIAHFGEDGHADHFANCFGDF